MEALTDAEMEQGPADADVDAEMVIPMDELLAKMVYWLQRHRRAARLTIPVPMCRDKKQPMITHKADVVTGKSPWTWATFFQFAKAHPDHMSWGLLMDGLCVVDADSVEACDWVVSLGEGDTDVAEALRVCPLQITKKGKHFLFKRSALADAGGFFDGAGAVPKIDFKTLCHNGTRGLLAVAPSKGKKWAPGRAPWDAGVRLVAIPEKLLRAVRVPTGAPASAPKKKKAAVVKDGKAAGDGEAAGEAGEVGEAKEPGVPPDLTEVRDLVALLSVERAESYEPWMRVGWCLHNISASLLDAWVAFSKRCAAKFKAGECEDKWVGMRTEGLGLRSLHVWAEYDNETEYRLVLAKRVTLDVAAFDGSHHLVAVIAHKLLGERAVCATDDGLMWYTFEGARWLEDKRGLRTRHMLTTVVRKQLAQGSFDAALADIDSASSQGGPPGPGAKEKHSALLNATCFKLRDAFFKDAVMREMRVLFYDPKFLDALDTQPGLLGFDNGVYDLKAGLFRDGRPEDFVSLSVGYDFIEARDEAASETVARYWARLHPDPAQRDYVMKTLARQLYGDGCGNLMHVHAGRFASAGNGKSMFFELLRTCASGYVQKFGVETLVAKKRPDVGKPMPEVGNWRGRRIIYCAEPNAEDRLNSGILKDLTGGDTLVYRLLFSNDIRQFVPQYKMHLMCNATPGMDGGDQGLQRRIRKIDYVAKFVEAARVDEAEHMYLCDLGLLDRFKGDAALRVEFLRALLDRYDHAFDFAMPAVVADAGREYLADNDVVKRFVAEYVVADPSAGAHFTLANAKAAINTYADLRGNGFAPSTLKNSLRAALGVECLDQKKISGVVKKNVFMGFRILPDGGDDVADANRIQDMLGD